VEPDFVRYVGCGKPFDCVLIVCPALQKLECVMDRVKGTVGMDHPPCLLQSSRRSWAQPTIKRSACSEHLVLQPDSPALTRLVSHA
jgi:hypothetical protein